MNAQNLIRPSSSGAFGGGAADQRRPGTPESPLLGPQSLESSRAPRTGASSFPATGDPSEQQPLPSHGAASQFSGTEELPSATTLETARAVAPGPQYILNDQREAHNFRLGPVLFRLGASLGTEYTDNVDNSSIDPQSDLITNGSIYLNGRWQLTKINDLNLRLGIGYTSYLANPDLNSQRLDVTPGTGIAFKMKVGPVYFDFYERPSVGQDSSNDLTLRSGIIYSSFQNDAGFTALLDLNDVSIQAGYNRSDTIALDSDSNSAERSDTSSDDRTSRREEEEATLDSLDRSVDTVTAAVTFRLQDDTSAGIEAAASRITYQENSKNNGVTYNAGFFIGKQLSSYITLRIAAGYQQSSFDSGGENEDEGGTSSPYYNLELRHRVNRFLTHQLAFGYETDLGTTTNAVQTTYISDQVTYQLSKDLALNLNVSYEIGEESGGPYAQELSLFRIGLSCGYNLTKKLAVTAFYQFAQRTGEGESGDSDSEGGSAGDYRENRVGVQFTYAF